jgi:hypothetical protein
MLSSSFEMATHKPHNHPPEYQDILNGKKLFCTNASRIWLDFWNSFRSSIFSELKLMLWLNYEAVVGLIKVTEVRLEVSNPMSKPLSSTSRKKC